MFSDEFLELSRELQKHHSIFFKFWKMGNPVWTNTVKTAAVEFDKLGECINFYINPEFWKTCSLEKKKFVIAHECLHVLLYHGIRASLLTENSSRKLANTAMDVVVNHTLVDNFGFEKEIIDPAGEYCWTDTVFATKNVPTGKSFEYYFHLLKQEEAEQAKKPGEGQGKGKSQPGQGGGQPGEGEPSSGKGDLVDDHDFLESFNNPDFEKQMQDALDNYDAQNVSEIVDKQTEDIQQQVKQAGMNPGGLTKLANLPVRIIKKKWETVIKNWTRKFALEKEEEQWSHKSRRMGAMGGDLMLPSERDVEFDQKHKIGVWFFQDTSGSCAHLADRFFAAASSLDPARFDVSMNCFDTKVYPTDLKSKKLYGFGGTSFSCIEAFIQAKVQKEGKRYPSAVFVITDGYGDAIQPEFPEKWYWFLSENYKTYIPAESQTFMLRDFE